MNLHYLVSNKNARFQRSINIVPFHALQEGKVWRGIQLTIRGSQLHVEAVSECHPFRSRPDSVGWYAAGVGGDSEIETRFQLDGITIGKTRQKISADTLKPVLLPWPVDPLTADVDLLIGCIGEAPIFVASSFDLDRKALIARCKGKGVELGPGPKPQILPSNEVDVFYIEQYAPAEWKQLYGEHYAVDFNPEYLPRYVLGDAHNIPVEAETLDFIFSSHVFEHLANPLGHLKKWSDALRPGGEVVMVVPDYIGSKDFLADPSSMDEFQLEFKTGSLEPTMKHYKRFAKSRKNDALADKLYKLKSSIHVHFYSNDNMAILVQEAIDLGFFRSYSILHSRNNKDFHIIITK